mmetsp:Transcript_11356/g.20549  ORF Transcript_11356/g.20549 Transcript_11356/m.20549 type:complete len:103 (+) Transcript_11356:248-556(+)
MHLSLIAPSIIHLFDFLRFPSLPSPSSSLPSFPFQCLLSTPSHPRRFLLVTVKVLEYGSFLCFLSSSLSLPSSSSLSLLSLPLVVGARLLPLSPSHAMLYFH